MSEQDPNALEQALAKMVEEEMRADEGEEPNPPSNPAVTQAGLYVFIDAVTSKSVKPLIEWIIYENIANPEREYLQIFVGSPGGSVDACFMLTDTMAGSAIPVYTTGVGMIASCGLLIFMAGEKGHRIITPNTSILSHQYSWGGIGKHHELIARAKAFEFSDRRIVNHYMRHTGLSEKMVRKHLLPAEDRWITPEEAVKLKIADGIAMLGQKAKPVRRRRKTTKKPEVPRRKATKKASRKKS